MAAEDATHLPAASLTPTPTPALYPPSPPSSTTATASSVHGLAYPPHVLDALPVLLLRPHPHPPVRALDAQSFARFHFDHLLAHAPDNALFPFLHGLEGDNAAQNQFFAFTSGAADGRLKIPRFRGLVWVACDPELEGFGSGSAPPGSPEDDDEDDELEDADSSDFDDERLSEPDAFGMPMDVDKDEAAVVQPYEDESQDLDAGVHMHPVHHRAPPLVMPHHPEPPPPSSAPINILDYTFPYTSPHHPAGGHGHDRRASNASHASHTTTSSSAASSLFESSRSFSTISTSFSSQPCSPTDPPTPQTVEDKVKLPSPSPVPSRSARIPLLTSSFRPHELLKRGPDGYEGAFIPPRVPNGISLRNFGIQVPVYATLSDIVVYSPHGDTRAALALADKFKQAIENKAQERRTQAGSRTFQMARNAAQGLAMDDEPLVDYNVFVLTASQEEIEEHLSHLVVRARDEPVDGDKDVHGSVEVQHTGLASTLASAAATAAPEAHANEKQITLSGKVLKANTISFAQREKDEMRELTKASEIASILPNPAEQADTAATLAGSTTSMHWDPSIGQIFLGNSNDVPMMPTDEHAYCPVPTAHASEPAEDDPFVFVSTNNPAKGMGYDICIECHDAASFPNPAHLRAAEDHLAALDDMWAKRCGVEESGQPIPVRPPPNANSVVHFPFPSSPPSSTVTTSSLMPFLAFLERLLQPPGNQAQFTSRIRARSGSVTSYNALTPPRVSPHRTRPVKILVYSADGYTESSVLALSILMFLRGLSLPEAYLELQVTKRRSFFVYQADLGVLKRIDQRLERDRSKTPPRAGEAPVGPGSGRTSGFFATISESPAVSVAAPRSIPVGRPAANSVSNSGTPTPAPGGSLTQESGIHTRIRRPRATTSPMLPSLFSTHESWFNDSRFDGSFPSRVLPFLYLGNLNHATNAFMLHALGITHVVSVGECALVPPPGLAASVVNSTSTGPQYVPGKGPGAHGSLWIEEREGRIKVLDIKDVCDDGIDTLEPQLAPICDWIDKARSEGGQILVHCRVGVSRSATVVIAYVMQHLGIPLVDAYLIVRSRRLSVLIQPNLRLLYNLQAWEIKLALQRAAAAADERETERRLKDELARSLNWPYLAKEVHALNEKYLH